MTEDNNQILYLRDGLIILTENSIATLLKGGLSREVAEYARKGLILKERKHLSEVAETLSHVLNGITQNNAKVT